MLRRSKLDELPQLFNISQRGDVLYRAPAGSFMRYTMRYTPQEQCILWVRPGISDPRSIRLINLDELVGHDDPEGCYETKILAEKEPHARGLRAQPVLRAGCEGVLGDAFVRTEEEPQQGTVRAAQDARAARRKPMNCQKSRELAYKIRLHALEMTSRGGTSHIASIFSMADLVAVLYADVLRYDPNNPRMPERDRLILSKGTRARVSTPRWPKAASFPWRSCSPTARTAAASAVTSAQGRAGRGGIHGVAGSGHAHGHGHGHGPQSSITKSTACTASSATVNATRAPSGKARSSPSVQAG